MTRSINHHLDGHGLNEKIEITTDAADESGAAHLYELVIDVGGNGKAKSIGFVQFQKGPRLDPSSTPGATEAALLAVLIDRMEGFQAGPYACRENAIQLTKLQECMHWTRHRADERARRGVLGKSEK